MRRQLLPGAFCKVILYYIIMLRSLQNSPVQLMSSRTRPAIITSHTLIWSCKWNKLLDAYTLIFHSSSPPLRRHSAISLATIYSHHINFSALLAAPPEPSFTTVSAGVFVTCAIDTLGALYCFGNNDDGAVGFVLPCTCFTKNKPTSWWLSRQDNTLITTYQPTTILSFTDMSNI